MESRRQVSEPVLQEQELIEVHPLSRTSVITWGFGHIPNPKMHTVELQGCCTLHGQ